MDHWQLWPNLHCLLTCKMTMLAGILKIRIATFAKFAHLCILNERLSDGISKWVSYTQDATKMVGIRSKCFFFHPVGG